MPKVTVLGNCQAAPVGQMLAMASSAVEFRPLKPIHLLGPEDLDATWRILAESDIVVHQAIAPPYPITSAQVLAEFPDKTFVRFSSIFFSGLFPHLSFLRRPQGGTLPGPLGNYHDLRVLDAHRRGLSQARCVALLDDVDIDVAAHYRGCILESRRREQSVDIAAMDPIEERIRESQTTYTFNHPDNAVLWQVAVAVARPLDLPLDGAQAPPDTPYLGQAVASVPPAVTETLDMSWSNENFWHAGRRLDRSDIVAGLYAIYDAEPDMDAVVAFNRSRFGMPVSDRPRG
jgi:hypothetical protein